MAQKNGQCTSTKIMKKLDWYIFNKYIKAFFFTAFIFTMIALTVDVSEKIGKILDQDLSFVHMIKNRYIDYIPYINGELWPLFALISVIFVASRMASNSEVISILSSGTSFSRYLRPYIIASVILTCLFAYGKHIMIPTSNKAFKEHELKYFWPRDEKILYSDVHVFLSPETKVYIRNYRKRDTTCLNVVFETFNNGPVVKITKVKSMKFIEAPNRWRLKGVVTRTLDNGKETIIENKETRDTSINLQPSDFKRYIAEREKLTTTQLVEYIAYEKSKGLSNTRRFEIEVHKRTSEPVTLIILTLIGACIASRKKRGGIGLNLAVGVGLGALFIVLSKFSQTFSINSDLHPMIGVWIPNLLFSLVAIITYIKAQK